MSGIPTPYLPTSHLLDELVGNYDGTTVRAPIGALVAQLGGAGMNFPQFSSTADAQAAQVPATTKYLLAAGRIYERDPLGGSLLTGDGARWRPMRVQTEARPLFFVGAGQSNWLGMSGTTNGERAGVNGNIWIFENIPGAGQTVGWKNAAPSEADWPFGATGNSLPYHIADFAQRLTGRPVFFVSHGAGGQPIAQFLPIGGGVEGADGQHWSALQSALTAARAAPLPTGGTLASWGIDQADAFFWHQGEADADYRGTTGPQWRARLKTLEACLRDPASRGLLSAPVIKPDAPIIIGELLRDGTSGGEATDSRNVEIARIHREDPLISAASSADLTSHDNLHFDGRSLQVLAGRYAIEWLFAQAGQKLVPQEVSVDHVNISGRVVVLRGNSVTVNAGATVTVNLPVRLADAYYVPTITLTAHGNSSPFLPLVQSRGVTSFNLYNPGGHNMVVAWTITALQA